MPRASTATCCNRRATTVACRGRWRGEMAGTLYVVATPLGNLEDLSPRAAATLTRAAAVAAEDTRHTKPLLAHIASRAKLISFHAHSSDTALRRILHLLATGKDVALVTDAGTPTVSDPGALLVAAARARDIPVVTVPGPTAVAAALSVSGLGADRYLFVGLAPRKGAERRRLLERLAKSEWTVVLFEAPPRVAELLEDLAAACGAERPAAVARELTKLFEETRAGTLAELAGYYAEAPARGEVTVMVAGTGKPAPEERAAAPDPPERARALLAQGMTRRGLVAERERVVTLTGPELWDVPYLFMTGHGNVHFSDEEVKRLRRWLEQGGFLHADDDYGMDKSFRREIARVFPDHPMVEVPLSHPIYHLVYDFPRGIPKIHEHDGLPAQGFGIFLGNRLVVYYSYQTDLGDGWEDPEVHHDPPELHEAALRMGVNLFTYAVSATR